MKDELWITVDTFQHTEDGKVLQRTVTYIYHLSERKIEAGQPIEYLMEHFLNEDFDRAYPEMVSGIRSEEYYVNMMIAWYFATALAKQYEAVLPYFTGRRLAPWVHNKAIQKAIESYRITDEQKAYLRTLKIK